MFEIESEMTSQQKNSKEKTIDKLKSNEKTLQLEVEEIAAEEINSLQKQIFEKR